MGLQDFSDRIRAWTESALTDYVAQLAGRPQGGAAKEFNDPVWGTIVVQPLELVILDSPLLQRLRLIRQLGVVHYVYPAANHSRFEHTLGVMHQINRLVESFNEHFVEAASGADPRPAILPAEHTLLRLAALCHDIGHGAMSHVSENGLENFAEVEDLRNEFAAEQGLEETALGEMVSFLIVGTRVVGELLKEAFRIGERALPDQLQPHLQSMIVGRPVSSRVPLLQELISGPFDADKLDYMTRDAFMTGVPVVTDIARLVQKVRAVEVPEAKLPPKIAHAVSKDARPTYIVTGISLSGGRTLDELMFGQVLLRDKLYRHSKVRAAEAMIASIFRQIGELPPGGPPMLPYTLVDHELIDLDQALLERIAGRVLTDEELVRGRVAIALARRLRNRDLFVRAFAFALAMPLDPYNADTDHYLGLETVVRNSDDYEFRGRLVGLIADEAAVICGMLAPELLANFGDDLKPYIWLDPPVAPRGTATSLHAYLVVEQRGRQELLPFSEGIAGASRWSDAYLLTRDTGYIFTVRELAEYVHVASEVVLRREHNIRTPRSMRAHIKQDTARLDDLRDTLASNGYYKSLPSDVRPVAQPLRNAGASQRIDAVRDNLRRYDGPSTSRSDKGEPLLNPERIRSWLSQFDANLGDEPLSMIERIRLITRDDVVNGLRAFVAEFPSYCDAYICPLGSAKDSSAITTYYANDLRSEVGIRAESLAVALASDRPIIFLDDFIGTGHQATSILEAWLGAEPTTVLGEARGDPMSASFVAALRDRELGFCFTAGMAGGADHLRATLPRLGLKGHVFLPADARPPEAFAGDLSSRQEQLRRYCDAVGRQLLDDGDPRHGEAWRAERALGYGNQAFLVCSTYNTPTQALTCLWKEGVYEGVEWIPLLPRRPKT